MYIDSHCHINFPELNQKIDVVLNNMESNKISHALCVSVTLDKIDEILDLTRKYSNIYASVGVHPDYEDIKEPDIDTLFKYSKDKKVVAIGETGLDYFRLKGDLSWQRDRFRTHIKAAIKSELPLIIHTRNAPEDTISIMREEGANSVTGVMHCFTESYEMAKNAIDLGFYISFSGIITFKNAETLRETVKKIPLENILIETDSPYLSPVPNRGKLNEPSNVRYVAEKIAELKGISVDKVAEITTNNFFKLFTKCKIL
ncbi:TatD family hydrolase [Methylophilaceae bacterium]|jgi:TatD DNase family protein|nr:TatD family hydrolase [Methylophilaceae bacterium]|tara:strand:- start:525 stop:1298 length:774 start_codon:yes stop_codon:yes gene_type:complete